MKYAATLIAFLLFVLFPLNGDDYLPFDLSVLECWSFYWFAANPRWPVMLYPVLIDPTKVLLGVFMAVVFYFFLVLCEKERGDEFAPVLLLFGVFPSITTDGFLWAISGVQYLLSLTLWLWARGLARENFRAWHFVVFFLCGASNEYCWLLLLFSMYLDKLLDWRAIPVLLGAALFFSGPGSYERLNGIQQDFDLISYALGVLWKIPGLWKTLLPVGLFLLLGFRVDRNALIAGLAFLVIAAFPVRDLEPHRYLLFPAWLLAVSMKGPLVILRERIVWPIAFVFLAGWVYAIQTYRELPDGPITNPLHKLYIGKERLHWHPSTNHDLYRLD